MINRKEAEKILKETYPDKKIVETWIYKNKAYLFNALDDPKIFDKSGILFMVGDDKKVRPFAITSDYEGFMESRKLR